MSENAKGLSDECMAVLGAWFGMMSPGKGELTFELQQGKPAAWAQEALNELVRRQMISVEPMNGYGGLRYRAVADCSAGFDWMMSNRENPVMSRALVTPVGSKADAKRHQKAALTARAADEGEGR